MIIRGSLTGKITDKNGQPIASANLILQPDMHQVQTDKNGYFTFKNIIAGEYNITVSYIGHQLYQSNVQIEADKKNNIKIILEEEENTLKQVTVYSKETKADNLLDIQRSAMPVTVITKETIAQMGSRRLDEVLKEQTGIAVVNDIGGGARAVGVQMQGFGSDYVMILIDGQPMVGRNSGNFDLSRISVSNIERIEIIKGASSCLFGSEALGGAINIVTRHGAFQPQALASVRYGSLHIVDATLEGETPFHHQRGSANISANYYRTDGFNTDPNFLSGGTTAPPYDDYTLQGRVRYRLTENSTLGASGRYALRKSFMEQIFGNNENQNSAADSQNITDINASVTYDNLFDNGLRSMSRYYLTRYVSDMSILWQESGSQTSAEKFAQTLHRFEQQFSYAPVTDLKLTAGLGGTSEQMDNRNFNVPGGMWSGFTYLQADWKMNDKFEAVGGFRYDHNNSYGGKLNPSLGLQYHIIPKLTLKIAMGSGFKTPDYRQRYQVFMNPTANYLVIGSEILRATLEEMKNNGQISEVREYLVNQLDQNLQAEKSLSFNGGFTYTPKKNIKLDVNAFYHNISNQINSIRVATGTNVRDIYTYQNLPKSFNTGLEMSLSIRPLSGLDISTGYQYLIAKDRGVMDSISNGTGAYASIRDNATGLFRKSRLSDYFGIENRSRHMANLRAAYNYTPWDITGNIRVNYRGKYGFVDSNNNRFLDQYDIFVKGHFLLNAAIEKKLMKQRLSLQLTADNIMDYTDRLMPGQPGRVLLLGLKYRFYKE
ncbi:TonB-dependent receptor [Flavobacterium ajazii]|uniref:TonB-dependent receptor n=1 Tax=Flavobacterium ajazii TaxID=2692318 RepID=UPI001CB73002|nr:TonB-dependent receptor [Flavobacterium ajazii]